jgi:hypothetical protein
MKRLRYQRSTLGIGLIMALAIGTVAGVLGYYGVLVWRSFSTDAQLRKPASVNRRGISASGFRIVRFHGGARLS